MYYVTGASVSSLHRESTDSLIDDGNHICVSKVPHVVDTDSEFKPNCGTYVFVVDSVH